MIKKWLYSNSPLVIDEEIRTNIQKELPLNSTDKDLNNILTIIHRLSNMPWYTQRDIMKDVSLNQSELIKLNKTLEFKH